MGSISLDNSWWVSTPTTTLSMTKPPESSFMDIKSSPLPTPANSQILLIRSSCHENLEVQPGVVTVISPALAREVDAGRTRENGVEALWSSPFVENSIKQLVVNVSTATSSTNVPTACPAVTLSHAAPIKRRRGPANDFGQRGKHPWYMRFIFGKGDFSRTPSATYTESAATVPCVPTSDYRYTNITSTIHSFPHLFSIITPINADQLELLLCNHPNSELVGSICHGLRSGFWLFADMASPESIPQGSIAQPHGLLALNDASENFLRSQCDTEISLG